MKTAIKLSLAAGALAMTLGTGVVIGQATAAQWHMRAALHHLEAAADQLREAERNKAGHRWHALQLTREAIDETRAGMDAAEDW